MFGVNGSKTSRPKMHELEILIDLLGKKSLDFLLVSGMKKNFPELSVSSEKC